MAVLITLLKTDNTFSNPEDYAIFLNSKLIDLGTLGNFEKNWDHVTALINENGENIIVVQHLDEDNYEYFIHTMVYPLFKDASKTDKFILEQEGMWENYKT